MDHCLVSSARVHSSHASKRSMWRRSVAAGSALALAGGLILMAGASASASGIASDPDMDPTGSSQAYVQTHGGDSLGHAEHFAVIADAAATVPNNTLWGHITAGAAVTDPGTTFCGVTAASPEITQKEALEDATAAYDRLKQLTHHQSGGLDLNNDDLGGQTIYPGVYHRTAALSVTSTATFDAQDDENAVFVIQTDAALNSTAGTVVKLAHGAQAKNIFWIVPAATTLGASSIFYGTILTHAAVTIGAGTVLYGRAFSLTAAATLGDAVDAGPGTKDNNGQDRPSEAPADRNNGACSPAEKPNPDNGN